MRRKIGATRRKRTVKKVTRRRRRRISGTGDLQGMAMTALGVIGGAIAARELSNIVLKQFPGMDQKLIGAGQVVVGLVLPKFVKSKLGTDIGNGMVAFGGQVLAVNFGLIAGVKDTVSYRINGMPPYKNVRSISGGSGRIPSIGQGSGDLRSVGGLGRVTVPRSRSMGDQI